MKRLAALLLLMAAGAAAQTPHHPLHAQYQQWQTITGASCCNSMDCAPTNGHWRITSNGYEVNYRGEWLPVPAEAVRPYASPDGDAHACVWNGRVLCFVRGQGV